MGEGCRFPLQYNGNMFVLFLYAGVSLSVRLLRSGLSQLVSSANEFGRTLERREQNCSRRTKMRLAYFRGNPPISAHFVLQVRPRTRLNVSLSLSPNLALNSSIAKFPSGLTISKSNNRVSKQNSNDSSKMGPEARGLGAQGPSEDVAMGREDRNFFLRLGLASMTQRVTLALNLIIPLSSFIIDRN